MDYSDKNNSKLIFREYGRNIQNLVAYAKTIEEPERRNAVAESIINLMGHLNPHLRNVEDFRHKLWDHLFILADFDLDVDSPYPIPSKEELEKKPDHIGYPKSHPRFRQYGRNVETMVQKAIEMEDEEKKQEFSAVIASYMKLVYKNWNRENVSDDIIINDLNTLSKGKLKLEESADLDMLSRHQKKRKKPAPSNSKRRPKNSRR
ncbi:MAG: DUF4290 domain-containing protein [Chitinophagales bacterium]|nr:DUF4290 domain-containing protein [Chitinophagales bacterium]